MIMVLSAQGTKGGEYTMNLPMSYGPGTVAMDVLNCVNYTVAQNAGLDVGMEAGEPRVLFPVEMLAGSGLCGFAERSNVSYAELKLGKAGLRVRGAGTWGWVVLVGWVVVFML